MLLGDEFFSDSFPVKLIDDLYYEVDGKVSWVSKETRMTFETYQFIRLDKSNLVPRARDLQGKNRELWDNP